MVSRAINALYSSTCLHVAPPILHCLFGVLYSRRAHYSHPVRDEHFWRCSPLGFPQANENLDILSHVLALEESAGCASPTRFIERGIWGREKGQWMLLRLPERGRDGRVCRLQTGCQLGVVGISVDGVPKGYFRVFVFLSSSCCCCCC